MPTGLTAATVVNRATVLFGGFNNQGLITGAPGSFGPSDSAIAQAANQVYNGVVQTVARETGYDFSRRLVNLAGAGLVNPPFPWSHAFLYPADCVQIRQIMPAAGDIDPNNPLPWTWSIENVDISSVPTKVVLTNFASAQAVYTNQPPEATWDSLFTESVVRLLASELAMAIEGRPQTAGTLLDQASGFGGQGAQRDG